MGDAQVPWEYVCSTCDDQKVIGHAKDSFIWFICLSNDTIVLTYLLKSNLSGTASGNFSQVLHLLQSGGECWRLGLEVSNFSEYAGVTDDWLVGDLSTMRSILTDYSPIFAYD